jgi:thiol-disulfide isomerase/thioredoxin
MSSVALFICFWPLHPFSANFWSLATEHVCADTGAKFAGIVTWPLAANASNDQINKRILLLGLNYDLCSLRKECKMWRWLPLFLSVASAAFIDVDPQQFFNEPPAGFSFVAFTAPWCGHCNQFKPILNEIEVSIPVLNVDASTNDGTAVRSKYGVTGFPTIQLLWNGAKTDVYTGARSKADIESWIESRIAPPLKHVTNVTEFFALESDIHMLLKTPSDATPEFLEFQKLSEARDPGVFYGVFIEEKRELIIRNNLEQAQITSEDMSDIGALVNRYKTPSVMVVSDAYAKYAPAMLHNNRPKMILFDSADDKELSSQYWVMLRKLADETEAVPVLASKNTAKNLVKHFKLEDAEFPVAVFDANTEHEKLEMATPESARDFFLKHLNPHEEL